MRNLNATTLRGLWAAVPTPWDEHGRVDEPILVANVERYAQQRIDGVYTTDSDGEFYALELEEFTRLVTIFARAMERTSMDAAVGVTWCNTRGTVDRIKVALDNGISAVHVAFPFWMPLAKGDVPRFFEDLASDAPKARWIHYNTPRAELLLTGDDYAAIAGAHPDQLIGSKQGLTDLTALAEVFIHSPRLAHFVTDPVFAAGMLMGAKGVYSFWVNTLPEWEREWMDACLAQQWDKAMAMQLKLTEWSLDHVRGLKEAGHNHGILTKALGGMTKFLEDSGRTAPPYYSSSAALRSQLARVFQEFWGEEVRARAGATPER